MKVDSTGHVGEIQSERSSVLTAFALQIKALENRYPSASQSLFSILDQAIVSGTSFLTAVIVGRLTSADHLGLYYLILSLIVLASGIQEYLIAGPYMVLSKRRSGEELAEYGGSVWVHHLVLSLLTAGGLSLAIVLFTVMGSTGVTQGLWVLLGAGPLLLLRDGVRRFVFANLHVKTAIALDTAISAVQLSGLALLGRWGMLSIFGIYGIMGGASLLACLGWLLLDPPHVRFRRQRFAADWFHNWAFGKWALWSFLVTGTTPAVMLWILGLAFEPSATAMLGVCATLVGVMNVILSGVANVLTPLAAQAFASGGAGELRRILTRMALFLAIVLGGLSLLALPFGDRLVVLIFGAQYHGTGTIPFLLASSALMTGLGMIAGNGLWAIHQPRSAFIGDVFGMCMTLTAAALLIPHFGAWGAAMATLAGSFTATVARTLILGRFFAANTADFSAVSSTALCTDGILP